MELPLWHGLLAYPVFYRRFLHVFCNIGIGILFLSEFSASRGSAINGLVGSSRFLRVIMSPSIRGRGLRLLGFSFETIDFLLCFFDVLYALSVNAGGRATCVAYLFCLLILLRFPFLSLLLQLLYHSRYAGLAHRWLNTDFCQFLNDADA